MLWNAAAAAEALARAALVQQLPVLLVGHAQLALYYHSAQSQRILALPSVNVEFVLGTIRVN